ncbi:ABC transporter ATP-binding protein [Segnochrobactrum spirostomi]|uniref:ABC transporter ATP-binding protein n=1 Tax=Segnochrobactrum spirostomi TaxID=2608987 RepID=A0A6A7Y7Y3_9HYPH|nr:ABC transporter ATP-binding protein [Segnochrobactrum spirostomi]MQT14447.1 ABC transporter ATP-binding protein [Segnochrobactrum spirostomi]
MPTAAAEIRHDRPPRLAYERVSHSFTGLAAVDDVSLSVESGEILCLLGPSGCGKTTLLRIAAGIERQKAGRVVIDGEEVAGPNRMLPPEARGIGLVFQDYALFPHLTILDNVRFGLAGRPAGPATETAMRALERVRLAHYAKSYPHNLSGGEQQRVALARALAPEPRVLLLDEPFSGLDRRLRDQVRDDTLAVLRENGATAIVVTHDPEEAMRIGDRIALMRKGRLVQLGTPGALYRRPVDLKAARFFSEINELPARVVAGRVVCALGDLPAPASLAEGASAVVAVRPHDVRIAAAGGLPALVRRHRFLGEVDYLLVEIAGFDHPIEIRAPAGAGCAEGDTIRVEIAADACHIFKGEPA